MDQFTSFFGNNDGDGHLLQTFAEKHEHVSLYGIYAEFTVAERTIAMIHYPEPARRIAQSGQIDLVCYGHDHQYFQEKIDNCWLINPGEVMGRFGEPSWGLYDSKQHIYKRHLIAAN